jgi:hypothetical protein
VDIDASGMAVHASIALGLDFSFGSHFKSDVKYRFGSTVHPLGRANPFLILVLLVEPSLNWILILLAWPLNLALKGSVMIFLSFSLETWFSGSQFHLSMWVFWFIL